MALAWLRGAPAHAPALDAEVEALPPLDDPELSALQVVKNLCEQTIFSGKVWTRQTGT